MLETEEPVDDSSVSNMSGRLDMILFGATGYTGRAAVECMVALSKEKNFAWGVGGRSPSKLQQLLKKMSDKTGTDITKLPTFIADVKDEKSLKEMTKSAAAIVNCCGPYRFYGEPVIKACLATGTHHIDVSGEPQFMEQMQLKYHNEAEEKGIYIISACGFDSIPVEMGIIHMMNEFKGQLNSVETYMQTKHTGNTKKGVAIHYGTWESAIYSLVHANELRPLRQQLFPKRLPELKPKLKPRSLLHKSPVVHKWCLPFPGSDRSIALRSQRYFYENQKQRPIQVQTYVAFKNLLSALTVAVVAIVFGLMVKTTFTRNLLLNHPKIFSLGMVSHEGPTEKDRSNTFFSVTLYGEGWPEKMSEPEEEPDSPPTKTMVTKFTAQDPGYGFTVTALVLSAYMVLRESNKMPSRGGVFPPGAAFANTSLLQELQNHGLKVEILSEEK